MAEATQKTANYTAEMVDQMVEMYNELGNDGLDHIAESMDKSVRSVRSKLVREGVYVAQPKAKAKKADEPTKKEIMIELEKVVPFDTDGLMGATKACLLTILAHYEQ